MDIDKSIEPFIYQNIALDLIIEPLTNNLNETLLLLYPHHQIKQITKTMKPSYD